jgi:putative endonuclease
MTRGERFAPQNDRERDAPQNDKIGCHPERSEGSASDTPAGSYAPAVAREQFWVYIATNGSKTLYTGITSDLARRMYEHRNSLILGFTSRYRIDRLVYFETTSDVRAAIEREKQIKGWKRGRKIALIEGANPRWKDLSEKWSGADSSSLRSSE